MTGATARRARAGFLGVFWLYLVGLALATTPAHYAALDLAGISVLYALLAVSLGLGALWLACFGWLAALPAALGLAAVSVWHLREQTWLPYSRQAFVSSVVVTAVVLVPLLRALAPSTRRRTLRASLAAAAALVIALLGAYFGSNQLRWHLLLHNKLMGTPTFLALGRPAGDVRSALWDSRSGSGILPPAIRAPARSVPVPGASPDVVFVLIDTLRADALALHGGAPDLMPGLNRLAERSLVFEDLRANASWTKSSVASFFTGLLPEEHGAVDHPDRLRGEWTALAEVFADLGYRTAAFVTNYGNVGRATGFDQGFEEFYELKRDGAVYTRAEGVNAAVNQWIGRAGLAAPGRAPFFLYVHYLDPHLPYLSGPGWSPIHARAREAYDAELRYVDRAVSELVDRLLAALGSGTFVFVTSDHGEEFGDHGERDHGHSLYPEQLHLPAILLTPAGRHERIGARLEARDFFDLLAEIARGDSLDVVSWSRARSRSIRYASQYVSRPATALHRPQLRDTVMRSVEDPDWTLIWSGFGETWELYHDGRDPRELQNVARARRETLQALRPRLDEAVRFWTRPVAAEQSHDTIEMLRKLGYVQ